jgi:hypothetical protein
MRVRLAIALGLLVVLGWLAVVLSRTEQRLAWTNTQVNVSGNDVPIKGRKRACQPEAIPAKTAALRVFVGTRAGRAGPLEGSIRARGREVASGDFGMVFDGQPATAELSRTVRSEIPTARVCFRNRGRATVRLAGDRTPIRFGGVNPYGTVYDDEPRVDYLRPGEETWWSLAGTVADRFGGAKTTFFGPWTMWAVFALIGTIWLAAIVLMLRRLPAR